MADDERRHDQKHDQTNDQSTGHDEPDEAFVFPDIRYAHEDPADPLCVAGLERNARDLSVAKLACPESMADVEDHLARIAPRLGVTFTAGLDYCDVGLMLERLPDLDDVLEERPFLPWSHLRMIARAVIPLDDANLPAFSDRLLRYLAPRKRNQVLVGYRSLSSALGRIIGEIEPLAKPADPDEDPPPGGAGDPHVGFDVDDRDPQRTIFHIGLRSDLGREALTIIDAVAAEHGCSRRDALMLALRGTANEVKVSFNLYRDVAGGPIWMSGPGWLDEVANRDWVSRITGLRIVSNGAAEGYRPTEAMVAYLEGRDGVCRFPGCNMPAHRADKDHVCAYDHDDPAAGGPTATYNMHCLCRRHHNLKTSQLWDIELHPDGSESWSSRDGEHEFVTMPEGPLAGFGRQTFDARATRLTAACHDYNAKRIAAEEEARRRTREAQARAMRLASTWDDHFGPDGDGIHPDTGEPVPQGMTRAQMHEQDPDFPPF